MTPPPDLADKDALIAKLLARIEALMARVAELEAKLGLPPKTADNSSVPPSKGQKPSEPATPKDKATRPPSEVGHRSRKRHGVLARPTTNLQHHAMCGKNAF
jgi:hypothetical protein